MLPKPLQIWRLLTPSVVVISLFGAPSPLLPVNIGEIQCAGLGMAIDVVDSISGERTPGEDGECEWSLILLPVSYISSPVHLALELRSPLCSYFVHASSRFLLQALEPSLGHLGERSRILCLAAD
jgi:hypothetical protein